MSCSLNILVSFKKHFRFIGSHASEKYPTTFSKSDYVKPKNIEFPSGNLSYETPF